MRDFDFYPEFRVWWFALPDEHRETMNAVLKRYRKRLREEGTAPGEIERRVTLVRTRQPELEADFWNRFYTDGEAAFNTAPNAFLASALRERPPGRALDVGMGEGRNARFLARIGWDVAGFDPANRAVALAQKRARAAGVRVTTAVCPDRDFAFGTCRWDLIVLSWTPANEPARIIASLRPGGIVVFEGPRGWFPQNGLLKAFESLRVRRYEDQFTQGDFFRERKMPVLRLVAEKPCD